MDMVAGSPTSSSARIAAPARDRVTSVWAFGTLNELKRRPCLSSVGRFAQDHSSATLRRLGEALRVLLPDARWHESDTAKRPPCEGAFLLWSTRSLWSSLRAVVGDPPVALDDPRVLTQNTPPIERVR
jgi:hypothetical protein